jgi:hypothetical protein
MRWSLEEAVVAAREREPDPAWAELSDAVLVEGFAREASALAASTCRWLLMLAEIVRRGAWAADGATSPAAWLSWKVGMAASTAREHVRVALALAEWPAVCEAFGAGRMSYSQVRAAVSMGRPELDELAVKFSDSASGAQLQRISRQLRASDRPEPVDRWASRDVRFREVAGGMSEIRIVLPTEDALSAWNTLDRRADQLGREQLQSVRAAEAAAAAAGDAAAADEPDGPGDAAASLEPVGARRTDAFLEAVAGLDAGLPDDASGQDRHLVVLHTTVDALAEPDAGEDRLVTVADDTGRTPTLSARVIKRLTCTRARVVAHDADGEPAVVRDKRRGATPGQRRRLLVRDRGCRFPSCDRTLGLHVHHIVHWADGGPTELANLVLRCGAHHRIVHDQGWTLATDGRGRFTFTAPDGPPLPVAPDLTEVPVPELVLPEWPDEVPDDVDPWMVWPRTPLEPEGAVARPDYDACLFVLHQELERFRPPEPDEIVVAA